MGMDVSVDVTYIDHHFLDDAELARNLKMMADTAATLHESYLATSRISRDMKRAELHLQERITDKRDAEQIAIEMLEAVIDELGVPHSQLGTLHIEVDWS